MSWRRRGSVKVPTPLVLLLAGVAHAHGPPALALTDAQQRAAGVRVEHPVAMANVPQVEAYGLVLDPAALVTDMGRMEGTQAAWHAAQADAVRLAGLYRDNLNASLRSLQLAQAQESETGAQARAAAATFALQWGPVAALGAQKRHALIDALSANRQLLVRAGLPGQHLADSVGPRALLDIDGVNVAARVLGSLPRTDPQLQGAAWLLAVDSAPAGLGPGAHVRVLLERAPVKGLLVPAVALLYGESGAYVYRHVGRNPGGKQQYEAAAVQLLAAMGDGWLVSGLNAADAIVVQGAGVLWSLQGISTFSAAEEEHD
ncbi:MAG: hypothetical protein E6K35_01395 [Gammaproteobacteria bacterium]|nr:MAG: hypothetical protein E6K47_09685 [Gammaproteobacteria bacterium]TLY88501.1 MAG: hypothetical protein E6K35_01395 [Gammaproteobacteria bacterium]